MVNLFHNKNYITKNILCNSNTTAYMSLFIYNKQNEFTTKIVKFLILQMYDQKKKPAHAIKLKKIISKCFTKHNNRTILFNARTNNSAQ